MRKNGRPCFCFLQSRKGHLEIRRILKYIFKELKINNIIIYIRYIPIKKLTTKLTRVGLVIFFLNSMSLKHLGFQPKIDKYLHKY